MGNIYQAYNELIGSTDNNVNIVLSLIDIIRSHIQYFVDKDDYQRYIKLTSIKFNKSDLDYSFNDIKEDVLNMYLIECIDEMFLKYQIIDKFNNKTIEFYLIPDSLNKFIKGKIELSFCGGTIINPTPDKYFLYLEKPNFNIKFKKARVENLKLIENKINSVKYEEPMNNVLLQYFKHFRY